VEYAIGVVLIIAGIVLTQISGALTKKIIRANNPDANHYSAAEMKEEWQRVSGTGLIPSWVSLISLGGWGVAIWGVVKIISEAF